uniref:Uncharacterized protein n=1 Tax=Oncorhynchus tshawytscha TaxID=74940 RepID=A0A8C8HGX6_ONCTS
MKTSTLILLCATVFGAGLAQSLEVYPITVFCNGKKCLNPEGKLGKRFLLRKTSNIFLSNLSSM